jgi:hypothetical protein
MLPERCVAKFATLTTLAALVLVAGCSATATDDEGEAEQALTRGPHPKLSHLPDVGGISIGGCGDTLSGCYLTGASGKNPLTAARRIYDTYFHAPKTEADWGFHALTAEENANLAATPAILPLPTPPTTASKVPYVPPTKDEYKAWMSLRPDPWETLEKRAALRKPTYTARTDLPFRRNRTDADVKNVDVVATHAADAALDARDRGRAGAYEAQNPFDWLAAGVTHYEAPRSITSSDIMATNFVYRVLLAPYQLEQALADCKADAGVPCIGTVAALSDVDLYQTYEVRFVRPQANGTLQISRTFRMVSVDSGHAIDKQATLGPGATNVVTGQPTPAGFSTPYLQTYHGAATEAARQAAPRVLWRFEVSGQISTALGETEGAVAALVRYSPNTGKTPADLPPPGACTDVNDGEWKCGDVRGTTKTLKCMGLVWQTYSLGCHIPGM